MVAEVHFEAGYVPPHHSVEDFAQAIRAIGEPIHDRRADEISMAKLLTLLFEITALFDMATRTELVMLQKTMVVVEGVARTLDPKLDMWTTSEPVVRDWIERNLGPIGRIEEAGRGALRPLPASSATCPTGAARRARAAPARDRRRRRASLLDRDSVAAIGRARRAAHRWGTAALWIIAVSLIIIAASWRLRVTMALAGKRILLVIGGGIAAYKSLDLIRRLRERGASVRCILTAAAQQFVTPLSARALSGDKVYTDLFDRDRRGRDRPYPARPRRRSRRRRAGDRRPDGQDGAAATPTTSPRRRCSPPTSRSSSRRR